MITTNQHFKDVSNLHCTVCSRSLVHFDTDALYENGQDFLDIHYKIKISSLPYKKRIIMLIVKNTTLHIIVKNIALHLFTKLPSIGTYPLFTLLSTNNSIAHRELYLEQKHRLSLYQLCFVRISPLHNITKDI